MKDKYILIRKERYDELMKTSEEVQYLKETKRKLHSHLTYHCITNGCIMGGNLYIPITDELFDLISGDDVKIGD